MYVFFLVHKEIHTHKRVEWCMNWVCSVFLLFLFLVLLIHSMRMRIDRHFFFFLLFIECQSIYPEPSHMRVIYAHTCIFFCFTSFFFHFSLYIVYRSVYFSLTLLYNVYVFFISHMCVCLRVCGTCTGYRFTHASR